MCDLLRFNQHYIRIRIPWSGAAADDDGGGVPGAPILPGAELGVEQGLDLLLDHHGGRLSEVEQARALRALVDDPRLKHWRHPLVVEAHALFLTRAYYHAEPPPALVLPQRHAQVDRAALASWTVQALPELSVQYFRYPTRTGQAAAAGKIMAQPVAVLHDLARARQIEISLPVGALVERCLGEVATVQAHAEQTVALGQGEHSDVVEAILALVEAGFLVVTPPMDAPAA